MTTRGAKLGKSTGSEFTGAAGVPGPTTTGRSDRAAAPYPDPMPQSPRVGSSVLIRVGAVCFVLGLIAVAVVFGMFATGAHDLPLWLNLAAMLAPIGFGLALFGLFRQTRRGPRRVAAAAASVSR